MPPASPAASLSAGALWVVLAWVAVVAGLAIGVCELMKTYLMVDPRELPVALMSGGPIKILPSEGVTELDPGGHHKLGGCLL